MSNEILVANIQNGINIADNMAALWQQNKRFVYKMARRYQGQAEEEDLLQEGFIGLCNAVDGYDPDSQTTFLNYAGNWIRQAMQRYIENNGTIRIPVHRQADIRKYKRVVNDFQKHYGRKPEIRELMDIFYIPYKDIIALEKDAQCLHISSTEMPIGDDDGATLGELLPGCEGIEDDIIEAMDHEALKEILWSMVDELPGQQGPVIHARYQHGLTLQATGDAIGCTREHVWQEEAKGLRTLRSPARAKKLRPYYKDYVPGRYDHVGVQQFNRTWTSSVEREVLRTAKEIL